MQPSHTHVNTHTKYYLYLRKARCYHLQAYGNLFQLILILVRQSIPCTFKYSFFLQGLKKGKRTYPSINHLHSARTQLIIFNKKVRSRCARTTTQGRTNETGHFQTVQKCWFVQSRFDPGHCDSPVLLQTPSYSEDVAIQHV